MSMTDPVRCNTLTSYLTEMQDTERICDNSLKLFVTERETKVRKIKGTH